MTGQRSIRVAWIVLVLLGSPGSGGASAQTSRSGPACSLEWLACRSDVIVRARVVDEPAVRRWPWSCAGASVVERLKGELPDRFEFAFYSNEVDYPYEPAFAPKKWISRCRGREVLLFLMARENDDGLHSPSPSPLILDLSSHEWSMVILDGDAPDYVARTDFATIQDREEILKMTRTAVAFSADRPKPRTYRTLVIPCGTELSDKAGRGIHSTLLLPDDERLEKKAVEWTESANPWVKLEGIRVLRRKRTPKNVEILKSLSRDPSTLGGRTVVADSARAVLEHWEEFP